MNRDEVQARLFAMQVNTLKGRKLPQTKALIRNITRSEGKLRLHPQDKPARGRTAFVVGAGPSLDRNIEGLKDIPPGNPIFTVPTATPALVAAGVVPDVVIATDCLPLSHFLEGLDPARTVVATDWQANDQVFDRGEWMLATFYLETARILDAINLQPVRNGGSALTVAFDVADEWGADRIVLVGADLSWDWESGKAYADNSGWHGLTAERAESDSRIKLAGRDDRRELHRSNGIGYPEDERDCMKLRRWNAVPGSVPSTIELFSQLDWLTSRGKHRTDQGKQTINATEGGAHIPKLMDMALFLAIRDCEAWTPMALSRVPITAEEVDTMIDVVKRDASAGMALHDNMTKGRPAQWMRSILDGDMGLTYTLSTAGWMSQDTADPPLDAVEKLRQHYSILLESATAIWDIVQDETRSDLARMIDEASDGEQE